MSQKSLSTHLKLVILGVALCGIVCYAVIFPVLFCFTIEAGAVRTIALVFLTLSAIPCYVELFFALRVAINIGRDCSFTAENAVYLRRISVLSAATAAYIFAGAAAAIFIDRFLLLILGLLIVFVGVAVSVAAAVLSHLVTKAAALQEESELTI